ncbi:MAG: hypothetical protein MK171_07990 [Pirellulales bacterium]|nr:hypothetical protein [Pirellulales bacterium]
MAFSLLFLIGWGAEKTSDDNASPGRLFYNLDSTEYFVGTFGPVTPATIDKFVDLHAAAGVTDLLINVNAQRTNYRSDVWESIWDGYDPNAGQDQPLFSGIEPARRMGPDAHEAQWIKNTWALHDKGCDYPKRMIDRARKKRVSPWISLRMNDSHHPNRPDHPYHSTFWKSHPEWHLEHGLDYEQPAVRHHYMNLVQEVCSRYDLDGLELDFLRFWLYFRDGREHEGAKLMLTFIEQARSLTRKAAKRLGHPVELAVRVPGKPWIARRHGLDAVAWARAGLVDLIVAGSFWFSVDTDMPIETWKGLLVGTDVDVAVSLGDGINSGASGRRTMTHEEMRGVLASGLHRGADGVYFFNLFTGPYQYWPRCDYDRLLADAGSYQVLCNSSRRHALSITAPWAAGASRSAQWLPFTGRHGVFRLHIGPEPRADERTHIELKLKLADASSPPRVHLNGIGCSWSKLTAPVHVQAAGSKPPELGDRHIYDVPASAVSEGYNLVEVFADEDVEITWVEIVVQ